MRLLVEYHAEHKVLFGSDFPFTTTADSVNGLRNINAVLAQSGLPRIPDEAIEGIIFRDALSLLGLEDPRKRHQPCPGLCLWTCGDGGIWFAAAIGRRH